MSDKVRLHGIDLFAYHGVLPEETSLGQRFVVDVELSFDCATAADSDNLDDALDYTAVYDLVKTAGAEGPFNLIEAVAGHLCRRLLTAFPLSKVKVTVHKPNPPIPGFLGSAAVTLKRDRAWLEAGDGA